MRIVAIHFVGNPIRRERLPDSWDVIEVDTPIAVSYRQVSKLAMTEGWDQETILVQDDVRFEGRVKRYDSSLVVYGQTTNPGHVCPRAFAADQNTWADLYFAWMTNPNPSVCYAWKSIVHDRGLILDSTKVIPDRKAR